MDDAKLRAIARYGRDYDCGSWDEARWAVEHSFLGAQYELGERVVDLGRAVRDALPGPLRRLLSGILRGMNDEPYRWGRAGPAEFGCEGLIRATEDAAAFWSLDRLDEDPEEPEE